MAYSNYGAFVYKNGIRQKDKEDAEIWDGVLEDDSWEYNWIFHGVMGDGDIRVGCYKQGLPQIFKKVDDCIEKINYNENRKYDYFEYGVVKVNIDGYRMEFRSKTKDSFDLCNHYEAEMTTPTGDHWFCEYDYGYGAGITD